MKSSSEGEEVKVGQDREMALKMALEEYRILEQAVGTANTAAYAVAGIFMGGLFAASAMLIPNLVQQDCGWRLCGYLLASVVIVACMQFWFWGIHLRWRVVNAIMYHRLEELERDLNFYGAHTRIHEFYESQKRKRKKEKPLWQKNKEPPWYKALTDDTGSLIPRPPSMNYWWRRIVRVITVAYVITWLLAIVRWIVACPYMQSFLQCLLG